MALPRYVIIAVHVYYQELFYVHISEYAKFHSNPELVTFFRITVHYVLYGPSFIIEDEYASNFR